MGKGVELAAEVGAKLVFKDCEGGGSNDISGKGVPRVNNTDGEAVVTAVGATVGDKKLVRMAAETRWVEGLISPLEEVVEIEGGEPVDDLVEVDKVEVVAAELQGREMAGEAALSVGQVFDGWDVAGEDALDFFNKVDVGFEVWGPGRGSKFDNRANINFVKLGLKK